MQPSREQIVSQLETVLSSDVFSASPKLSKFLEYVVCETLEGRQNHLKAYTIGIDVLDRPHNFDASADNTVRVMAGRLRKALSNYFLTAGSTDIVRIELPKGSYVPEFSLHSPPELAAQEDAVGKPISGRRRSIVISGLLLAVAAVIVAIGLFPPNRSDSAFQQAAKVSTGPSVAVLPFETISHSSQDIDAIDTDALTSGLYFDIVGKLSRFKDLLVINANAPGAEFYTDPSDLLEIQFYLTGSVRTDGPEIKVTAVLTRASNAAVAWTETYTAALDDAASLFEIESTIASEVASALGRPSSILNKQFESEIADLEDVEAEHYVCLMQFYAYTERKSKEDHARVRRCLEKAVRLNASFSSGWAALSWMYGDEVRNGYNATASRGTSLERALNAASQAVAADPSNAMAQQYLAVAHFELGDVDGFRHAAKAALRLNPNDPEVLADIGSHLIQIGDAQAGKPLVEKAIQLNPAHPPWYHGSIIRYFYERGETEDALYHANAYIKDGTVVAHALLVACLVRAGELDEAKAVLDQLNTKFPTFKDDFQSVVSSWRMTNSMSAMVIEDLATAGMKPPQS